MIQLKRSVPLALALVLCATGAIAQTNSAHRSADVVAGKSHRLGVYGNVQKDCTSGPLPTVRVVTPPKHGELNVRSGKLKAGRISRCPKLEATAQGIFYKASPTRGLTRSAMRSDPPAARWKTTPSGSP